MTREQALKASRALDAIESFEMLADHIENVIDQYADDIPDIASFKWRLSQLLEQELELRKAVLEEL
jgi:hypothetical protein